MRFITRLACSLPLFGALLFSASHNAAACGGCFTQESESTQVDGHRMILSVSKDATSLWDQIQYSGSPESFAWVLPIKGKVDVGLSSDALFQLLDQTTQVVVSSPSLNCNSGAGNASGFGTGAGGGGGGKDDGVTILDQEVVGPYETVQLAAKDPKALSDWLASHGYNLPGNIQPVVDAYVNEGFGFLALKLVPGKGVESMQPVRITTPGAAPALPLRMVAAGTGVTTAVHLWVFSEGRYEPKNFPAVEIQGKDLTWNWDTQSSNYSELRQQYFKVSQGFAWLVDYSANTYSGEFSQALKYAALQQYADQDGMNAEANLDADMAALTGSLANGDARLTHMFAQLSRAALLTDLQLQASANQDIIYPYLVAENQVGTPPCNPQQNGGSANGIPGLGQGTNTSTFTSKGKGSCSVALTGPPSTDLTALGAGLAAAVALLRRKRRS